MKCSVRVAASTALLFLFLVPAAKANPVTILDNYIGAHATNSNWAGQDVIGSQSEFDIKSATINLSGGILQVSILSSYFDNVGRLNTFFGDLFLSSDGWKPFGNAPYTQDQASNGEDWEYAIVFDNHGEAYSQDQAGHSMIGASGNAGLYGIDDNSTIKMSNSNFGIFRQGQEVELIPNSNALAAGTWSIQQGTGGYSSLNVAVNILGTSLATAQEIGFHWAFSCANDVIEGKYTAEVPEPATGALLLAGALAALCRRRSRQ